MSSSRRRRWLRPRSLWLVYVLLLLVHQGLRVRPLDPGPPARGEDRVLLRAVRGERLLDRRVEVAYRDAGPREAPVLLLLHGSPGSMRDFDTVVGHLDDRYRTIAVDLPGFGQSQRRIPDYSIRAHALYVSQLLDRLGVERYIPVAFSMGGGVALRLYDREPQRITGMTLISSIGVQELELLGSYELNHLLHGVQLAGLWALENLIPHMGLLDRLPLGLPYARNFFDSDQRPLRGILRELEAPLLLVHGDDDPLVPHEAAVEHARLVPQAELVTWPASHFLLWTHARELAALVDRWAQEVSAGQAPSRDEAAASRVAAAQPERPPTPSARARGFTVVVLVMLLVLGTFVTEDLTSIAAGLLVADGRLSWPVALGAVFCGIYFGDLLLYLLGRRLGRAVLLRAPWRWIVKPEDLETAARWFDRRGLVAILLTRFVPGTRLPTYVAAGVVRARFWRFALYFLVAVSLWTPLLVGFAAVVGQEALERLESYRRDSLIVFGLLALTVMLVVRGLVPLLTERGRRLLVGRWRRLRHHEFWPTWVLYLPVAGSVLLRAPRHGGLRTLTAVNPGIEAGGFVGESKSAILAGFGEDERVARFTLLPGSESVTRRLEKVDNFCDQHELQLPLVLKPDVGQRGEGVRIVRRTGDLEAVIAASSVDLIAQEYVGGLEYGIFYVRESADRRGRIFSITEKRRPVVVGDGLHTLEHLILHDPRAVCLAPLHLRVHAARLDSVPTAGERIELVEVGTHARGAIFLDARQHRTEALEASVDDLSRRLGGFWFGRYDVRVAAPEELMAGRGWKVVEVNGLTSEAAHVYDPRSSLLEAWRTLLEQWGIAYRIGESHRRAGVPVASWGQLWDAWRRHRELRRGHPPLPGSPGPLNGVPGSR